MATSTCPGGRFVAEWRPGDVMLSAGPVVAGQRHDIKPGGDVMPCQRGPGAAVAGLTWLTTPDITDVMPLTCVNAAA